MSNELIINKIEKLYDAWKQGILGGEYMPEDSNPNLNKDSLENYIYFTLPMALNYQRNSYTLWESAKKTYEDEDTKFVFNPKEVVNREFFDIQQALVKYGVALQKNKQTEIWIKLCNTIVNKLDGDIRNIIYLNDSDVNKIRNYIQKENKKDFPYLSGNKICNYWLFVLHQYTNIKFKNLNDLTVAPDTHVVKASYKLNVIDKKEFNDSNVQLIVIDKWNKLLKNHKLYPIDLHTALWLWSRSGFKFNLD